MKKTSYNNFFGNFATKSKFDIIMALKDGPLNVSQIAGKLGEEQSAVSHNLAKMSSCYILNVKREGKQRIYSLNEDTVIPILEIVDKHVKYCCLGRCRK